MLKNFRQLQQFLVNHYPELYGHIRGELYNPPFYAVVVERIASAIQIFAMLTIFVGDSAWNFIPFVRGPPEFYFKLKQNPMAGVALVFFVLPSIVQSIATTGAFEIIVDGNVVYSAIEKGRLPNGEDIINAFNEVGIGTGKTQ